MWTPLVAHAQACAPGEALPNLLKQPASALYREETQSMLVLYQPQPSGSWRDLPHRMVQNPRDGAALVIYGLTFPEKVRAALEPLLATTLVGVERRLLNVVASYVGTSVRSVAQLHLPDDIAGADGAAVQSVAHDYTPYTDGATRDDGCRRCTALNRADAKYLTCTCALVDRAGDSNRLSVRVLVAARRKVTSVYVPFAQATTVAAAVACTGAAASCLPVLDLLTVSTAATAATAPTSTAPIAAQAPVMVVVNANRAIERFGATSDDPSCAGGATPIEWPEAARLPDTKCAVVSSAAYTHLHNVERAQTDAGGTLYLEGREQHTNMCFHEQVWHTRDEVAGISRRNKLAGRRPITRLESRCEFVRYAPSLRLLFVGARTPRSFEVRVFSSGDGAPSARTFCHGVMNHVDDDPSTTDTAETVVDKIKVDVHGETNDGYGIALPKFCEDTKPSGERERERHGRGSQWRSLLCCHATGRRRTNRRDHVHCTHPRGLCLARSARGASHAAKCFIHDGLRKPSFLLLLRLPHLPLPSALLCYLSSSLTQM